MSSHCHTILVKSNFFRFDTTYQKDSLQQYSVAFTPPVPDSEFLLRDKIVRWVRSLIHERVGNFVFANTMLFAIQPTTEWIENHAFQTTFEGVDYEVLVSPVGLISRTSSEERSFYNKFFNSIQGRLGFSMIGRKFYDPQRAVQIREHNLTVWPGFSSAVHALEGGCFVNIDISHRCLRNITVYEQLEELQRHRSAKESFEKLIVGTTVITPYNNSSYHIEAVDWDKSPLSQLDETISFVEYYATRWNRKIVYLEQPLLKSRRRNNEVLLLPELCISTGLTGEMKADLHLMKTLATITKKHPEERLRDTVEMVNKLNKTPKIAEEIAKWRATLHAEPTEIRAKILSPGNIVMGSKEFPIENGSFDREIQAKMLFQPKFTKWGIFHCAHDAREVENFLKILQVVTSQFEVVCNAPVRFTVNSEKWEDWDQVLSSKLSPDVTLIVCVLPGSQGKSPLYDNLKRLTLTKFPVPSQVILNSTLKKEKGLRSIINKLIIQMNAKVGGVPWGLQYSHMAPRTMIVGIDIYHKRGLHSVLGVCATVDPQFSRYFSIAKVNAPSEEISSRLTECVTKALEQYRRYNGEYPQRVLVYRDGVSDAQRPVLLDTEVPQISSALETVHSESALTVVVVNKRVSARFYHEENNRVKNPPLGTCIDSVVVSKDQKDFYLLPARAQQGVMTPTHYHIILDNSGVDLEVLQTITYKLCFSYYNWTGAIRVPAPCQYAHKLAYMVGERANEEGPPILHQHWENTRSLFFI